MPRTRDLSQSEQLVLLAALRLRRRAYGIAIRDEIERQTGRALAHATLYVVLDRLIRKGYLVSRQGEPTPERGGRSKLFVTVTAEGRTALTQALRSIDALRDGIEPAGEMT